MHFISDFLHDVSRYIFHFISFTSKNKIANTWFYDCNNSLFCLDSYHPDPLHPFIPSTLLPYYYHPSCNDHKLWHTLSTTFNNVHISKVLQLHLHLLQTKITVNIISSTTCKIMFITRNIFFEKWPQVF